MKNRLKVFNTEGDMTIKATQEDTHIKGSQVTGENVTLEAKKDIAISAASRRWMGCSVAEETSEERVPALIRYVGLSNIGVLSRFSPEIGFIGGVLGGIGSNIYSNQKKRS